ncbi:polysaccharide deacetylase family protein [Paenibacillus sp. NPDC056579]|uniref:polysaccharide deacetylase n=1 Tax=Paenibacillus sp. NPDC056579 TaxID=3345871 RepID=UPI00367BE64B
MLNLFRMLRSRRIGLWLTAIMMCTLALMPLSAMPAQAADDVNRMSAHQSYSELTSGKRIWEEKAYVTPERPTVYLTFDDGPSKLTGEVLDILRDENVKATFFVLGQQVESHPELVRRAVEEGHAIGNHTYNHQYNEIYSSAEAFWNQVEKTESRLEEYAGIKPRLVRAPGGTFGNFDAFYFYYMDQAGYEVHDWNIDSGDSSRQGVPASEIVQTVKKGPFRHEVILLMHDGTGHEQTVKALPEIISLFKQKGYAFAPLTETVQPVHFSSGKVKWGRAINEPLHQKLLAGAGAHRASIAMESAAVKQSPLLLSLGGKDVLLDPEQYRMAEGSYQVPLRVLIEGMGGHIEWKQEERTAVARYGMYRAEYDFSRHELRMMDSGKETSYHLPQMELREGTVYVPLQDTVELLGCRVTEEEESKEMKHVRAVDSAGLAFMLDY